MILTIRVYRQYKRYRRNNFPIPEGIEFAWLGRMLYAICLALAVFAPLLGNRLRAIPWATFQLWYSYCCLGLIIYYLSISGFQFQPQKVRQLHFVPEEVHTPVAPDQQNLKNGRSWRDKLLALK
ncbi:MAG: hypothetical protein IPK21_23475 [Haliscomenobacter sp.]|nr:hypothetical protein [Haliscomenobacter sp.]